MANPFGKNWNDLWAKFEDVMDDAFGDSKSKSTKIVRVGLTRPQLVAMLAGKKHQFRVGDELLIQVGLIGDE